MNFQFTQLYILLSNSKMFKIYTKNQENTKQNLLNLQLIFSYYYLYQLSFNCKYFIEEMQSNPKGESDLNNQQSIISSKQRPEAQKQAKQLTNRQESLIHQSNLSKEYLNKKMIQLLAQQMKDPKYLNQNKQEMKEPSRQQSNIPLTDNQNTQKRERRYQGYQKYQKPYKYCRNLETVQNVWKIRVDNISQIIQRMRNQTQKLEKLISAAFKSVVMSTHALVQTMGGISDAIMKFQHECKGSIQKNRSLMTSEKKRKKIEKLSHTEKQRLKQMKQFYEDNQIKDYVSKRKDKNNKKQGRKQKEKRQQKYEKKEKSHFQQSMSQSQKYLKQFQINYSPRDDTSSRSYRVRNLFSESSQDSPEDNGGELIKKSSRIGSDSQKYSNTSQIQQTIQKDIQKIPLRPNFTKKQKKRMKLEDLAQQFQKEHVKQLDKSQISRQNPISVFRINQQKYQFNPILKPIKKQPLFSQSSYLKKLQAIRKDAQQKKRSSQTPEQAQSEHNTHQFTTQKKQKQLSKILPKTSSRSKHIKYQFSTSYKFLQTQIIDHDTIYSLSQDNKQKLALVIPQFDHQYNNHRISFYIRSVQHWVGIGVCDIAQVRRNGFCLKPMEFGEHGVYMLGCTGMIISNYKDIDNQANIGFKFGTKDQICVSFNSSTRTIIFSKGQGNQMQRCQIDCDPLIHLSRFRFCVGVCKPKDVVSIKNFKAL